jgi:hypothetical protein
MTRQSKYPETSTFHYYNANPKDRITTDCLIRAISTATEIPYNQVVMELAELQCKTGYDFGDKKTYDKYLESKGWHKCRQPRKRDNTKYTGEEWCRLLQRGKDLPFSSDYPRMVAIIGTHHIVAIVDGKVWDTWDSTDGCIGNYWVKW